MVRIVIKIDNLNLVLRSYNQIKVYRSDTVDGTYTEITTPTTRIPITVSSTLYDYYDDAESKWYRYSFYSSSTATESSQSMAFQAGSEFEKVGYSFENYLIPEGEWGEVLTADDMRYTFMFGIDAIAADTNESEWRDEQFRQFVREAVADFEDYLGIDIKRRKYLTFPQSGLIKALQWRQGVDYTDEEDPYPYDPAMWNNSYGFLQLRHYPVITVTRAIMNSVVRQKILDFISQNWLRYDKQYGQLTFYPTGGLNYGPYAMYTNLWAIGARGNQYPHGYEIDYESGFETAAHVPQGLRGVIGKWAAIKCLNTIGDGLLAGFSSQSVSLDGLSESFSSTQSATSAYFGARIQQYLKEIEQWLKQNRHKFSIPLGFVGV